MNSLYVIMPVYFDAPSAELLTREIVQVLADDTSISLQPRIIWIDDSAGASGDVSETASRYGVRVLTPPRNLGHQAALWFAVRSIVEDLGPDDVVVTMDGDGEDRSSDVPHLVNALRLQHADVVLAIRGQRSAGLRFRFGYQLFRALYWILTGKTVETGNFAALNFRAILSLSTDPIAAISFSGTMSALRLRVRFLRCDRGKRTAGESRLGSAGLILHGLMMLVPQVDLVVVRAFFMLMFTLLLSVVVAVIAVVLRVVTSAAVPGWATSVVFGALAVSLIMFLLFLVSLLAAAAVRFARAPLYGLAAPESGNGGGALSDGS